MRKCITAVLYDVFQGMAEACKENRLEVEDLPQWIKRASSTVGRYVLADVEARNVFMNSFMWLCTDFLRHVVGDRVHFSL